MVSCLWNVLKLVHFNCQQNRVVYERSGHFGKRKIESDVYPYFLDTVYVYLNKAKDCLKIPKVPESVFS